MNDVQHAELTQTSEPSAETPTSPFKWLARRVQRNNQARVPTQRLYKLSEAAQILKCCSATLRRRAQRQQLSVIRFGRGWIYITESELRRIAGEGRR